MDEPLMPAFPPDYLVEWGEPGTSQRLQKILNLIDDQIRPNTTQADKQTAVAEWRSDVQHLKDLYASGMNVRWPRTIAPVTRFVG